MNKLNDEVIGYLSKLSIHPYQFQRELDPKKVEKWYKKVKKTF